MLKKIHCYQLVLTLLLSGCASQPIEHNEVTNNSSLPVLPQALPESQPQPLLNNSFPEPSHPYYADTISGDFGQSIELHQFIDKMVTKHGFSSTYLNGLFSQAQRLEQVINLESPAPYQGPSKPRLGSWTRYRNKFLTAEHIKHGVEFWRNNAQAVQLASQTYGVDPEYIVAIIGVETYFGRNIGKTKIIDALSTLAFATHRRAKYFSSELEHYLLMTREQHYEPRQPVGSWAGAMGLGQFMPSSFRKLAVDFDHNGRCDIWQPTDAIGSVAHYFAKHGWQRQRPVTQPSRPSNNESVIELSTYQGSEFWQIHPNFKVIKRYNNSNKYAMAVHQLAQAIKQRYL